MKAGKMKLLATAILGLLSISDAIATDQTGTQLRRKQAGASFISSLQFTQVLRVCNAYPFEHALDVYVGKNKITQEALPYKKCVEFHPSGGEALKAGDKIDFKAGDSTSAGTFTVAELPSNDATLVLIIYRHDAISTGVSFESHVFANLLNAQVAVIDTYRGPAKATPRIQDMQKKRDPKQPPLRSEELRFDSVMAVNPGLYEVSLEDPKEKTIAMHSLVASKRESYVVVRVGLDSTVGKSYPQEIMVYPESDPKEFSGAFAAAPAFVTCMLTMVAALFA